MATASLAFQVELATSPAFIQKTLVALVNAAISVANEVANAVQTITFGGTVTGGTYTLSFAGQTTAAIAWNAAPGVVQAAFTALSTVGAGNAIVTGGPGPTNMAITFTGTLGNQSQTLATATSSLTGTSPTVTVANSTAGVSVANHTARAALALQILQNPNAAASQWAWGVAGSLTVQTDWGWSGGAGGSVTPTPPTPGSANDLTDDGNVSTQISAIFNAYHN